MFKTICSMNANGNSINISKDAFFKHVTLELECLKKLEEQGHFKLVDPQYHSNIGPSGPHI